MLHQHCQPPPYPSKVAIRTLAHAYNVCMERVLWNIHKHVGKLGVAIHNMAIIIFIMWKFHNCSCSYGRLGRPFVLAYCQSLVKTRIVCRMSVVIGTLIKLGQSLSVDMQCALSILIIHKQIPKAVNCLLDNQLWTWVKVFLYTRKEL